MPLGIQYSLSYPASSTYNMPSLTSSSKTLLLRSSSHPKFTFNLPTLTYPNISATSRHVAWSGLTSLGILRNLNLATSLARTSLLSLGTCLGKCSKTGKFHLHVTALDYLTEHAIYKVWVKVNGENAFSQRQPYIQGTCWMHNTRYSWTSRSCNIFYEWYSTCIIPSETLCDLRLTGFRDLVSLHSRQQIPGRWNLQRLLYFIKRMLEYIYERRIPCFKGKIYPMHIINQGKGDLFDQVSIADLPWLWHGMRILMRLPLLVHDPCFILPWFLTGLFPTEVSGIPCPIE